MPSFSHFHLILYYLHVQTVSLRDSSLYQDYHNSSIRKELFYTLALHICATLRYYHRGGKTPESWEKANAISFLKSGDHHCPVNNRYIRLTCILYKNNGKLITEKILQILNLSQHWFLYNEWCMTYIESWVRQGSHCRINIVRLFQSLYKVPYITLIVKLYANEDLCWLSLFQSCHCFQVMISSLHSNFIRCFAGLSLGTEESECQLLISRRRLKNLVNRNFSLTKRRWHGSDLC